MGKIIRTTLFILPRPLDQDKLLEAYKVLEKDQAKNGKPYILDIHVTRLLSDVRSLGYTIKATTTFASHKDMTYYDKECPAHAALRYLALGLLKVKPIVVNEEVPGPEPMFPGFRSHSDCWER